MLVSRFCVRVIFHIPCTEDAIFTTLSGIDESTGRLQSRAAAALYRKARPDVWVKIGERALGSPHVVEHGVLNREVGA